MNKKRGMSRGEQSSPVPQKHKLLLVLVVILFLVSLSSLGLGAKCELTDEYKILGTTGLIDAFIKLPEGGYVATGMGWTTFDGYEAITLEYATLKEDCNLEHHSCIMGYEWHIYDRACMPSFQVDAFVGQGNDHEALYQHGVQFMCMDYHKKVPKDSVLVGWGGGLCDNNLPVMMSMDVWNLSRGIRDDAILEAGFLSADEDGKPVVCDTGKRKCEDSGSTFSRPEKFIGMGKTGNKNSNIYSEDIVPPGWVIVGLGTATDDSADDLTKIRLKIRKLLIDADEDGIWDNPDVETPDQCVDWDNETGKAVLTKPDDIFKEGELAGCDCEQVKERRIGDLTCKEGLEGSLSERTCGDEGVKDLGDIRSSTEGEFICLKDDLIGFDGDLDFECDGWCWVWASGNAAFKIFTIKKPGEPAYDVVSNNQEWFECNMDSEGRIPFLPIKGGEKSIEDLWKKTNRFYCYQEGEHWSWAECAPDLAARENKGVKGRWKGEGLYSLPLEGEGEGAEEERLGQIIDIDSDIYEDFYGDDTSLDFSGYEYLNFMVKFVDTEGNTIDKKDIILPANVFLEIRGPKLEGVREGILYFNKSVLGYVINNPFFEDNWMQVKVPIKEAKGIKSIFIKSEPRTNYIKVRNVYLSKGEKPLLCSGQDALEESSWLINVDQGDPRKEITGEDLCKTLYGENAWLGNDEEVKSNGASCCGNDEDEYYAEDSENNYGCWNSEVIGSRETTMNVEYEVGYEEKERNATYPEVAFNYNMTNYYNIEDEGLGQIDLLGEDEEIRQFNGTVSFNLFYNKNAYGMGISLGKRISYLGGITLHLKLSGLKLESEQPDVNIYFLNNFTGENLGDEVDEDNLKYGLDNILVVAKTNKVELGQERRISKKGNFTYTCNQAECLYPLPGFPPYTITNSHPELYELWFISEDEEFLIDEPGERFNVPGNLKAKKVAQQVIFINEEDEETGEKEQGFYGCQAVDYLRDNLEDNLPYCAVKGDKFCAHSVAQEGYTTINSWSSESLTKWGYQEIGAGEEVPEEFELVEGEIGAEERNQSTDVIPGRNFLTNAEFTKFSGDNKEDLVGWEIFDNQGKYVENEREYVDREEKKISLQHSYKLKSERVAVPKEQDILFSIGDVCDVTIDLYDKDGTLVTIPSIPGGYYTGNASYLILEIKGPCEVKQPMLQLVDDLGEANYSYKTEYPERTGAACCPSNWCWNGYACVKEMSELSYMKEQVGEERFYRCIAGEWKHLPIKWDWNFDEFGFCSKAEQCFVVSSLAERADPEAKAEDFYNGRFPICINNSEYIFDHYCDEGNWSSRTKFLATKLLDFAGSDEYVLYCTNYREALLDYEEKESYLGGGVSVEVAEEVELGEAIGGEAEGETIQACFPELLGGEGERLVPEKENTCVNNVCVLRFKEGGKFKSAFALTLNKKVNESDSFLVALNIPHDKLDEVCQGGEDFIECDLGGLDIEGDLWYADKIEGVIYGKEGIKVEKGFLDKIGDWFGGLFGEEELEEEKGFVAEATNFKELYLLNKEGKKVRAMQEIFPKKKMIVAEYENFETPVCEYVEKIDVPPEVELEVLELEAGMQKINCTKEGNKQRFVAIAGLDFWWPQLTGKLRIGE